MIMNSRIPRLTLLAALGLLAFGVSCHSAAAAKTNIVAKARTVNPKAKGPVANENMKAGGLSLSNLISATIPQSTFTVPRKVTEARDPFFPNSVRVYGVEQVIKPDQNAGSAVDLALRGISGSAARPLAIINTTTFAIGETAEVLHKGGRTKVECINIDMAKGTVLVQVGTDRRQLRLNPEPEK
jgi:hypothetical protein